jgi:hypothetical protein
LLNNNVPSTYQPYYNGWDKSGTAATSGSGIHHPEGIIKKFSVFSTTLINNATHWRVTWANQPGFGHSVTAQGSSGSPLFNQNKLIVGTLTGGWSFCSAPTDADVYGKFSYHWQSNGTTNDKQLKPWLDAINANPNTKTGVNFNACSPTSVDEISGPNLNILISPNPASDFISLEFENYYFENGQIRIFDVLGKLMKQVSTHAYQDAISISVSELPNGLYFINANNSQHHFSKSFIISR